MEEPGLRVLRFLFGEESQFCSPSGYRLFQEGANVQGTLKSTVKDRGNCPRLDSESTRSEVRLCGFRPPFPIDWGTLVGQVT